MFDSIQQIAMTRKGRYLAWIITALFIVLILSSFYNGFALLTSKSIPNDLLEKNTFITPTKKINVARLHLFGLYQPANLNIDLLPKSTLNIQLNGVFFTVPANLSQAVLTIPSEGQKIYREGDKLPGDAKLYRILNNSVIIEYNGKLQRLMLPEPTLKFNNKQPNSLNLPTSRSNS